MSQDSQGSINSLELMSQETHDVLQALLNSDGKGPNIEPAEYVHVLVIYFNTITFSVRGSSLRFSLHALAVRLTLRSLYLQHSAQMSIFMKGGKLIIKSFLFRRFQAKYRLNPFDIHLAEDNGPGLF